jgi:RNA polymerase sigma factor (sigma-70 family)
MSSYDTIARLNVKELVEIYQNETHLDRDNAFYAIVDRYKRDLTIICEKRCEKFGQSSEVVYELVNNVFKAYACAPQFDFEKRKVKDEYKAFLAYLVGIAKNELTNIFRVQRKKANGTWSDGSERIITDLPSIHENSPLKAKVIHGVLSDLPYSHRVIYCTYTSYEKVGCNLPRKLQEELRNHLGISQTSVRVYKKEALDKIKIALKGLDLIENK